MLETLKRLYHSEKITVNGLDNAVIKGWITEEQKSEIEESGNGGAADE